METIKKKILSVSVAAYNVESTIEEALNPFLKCNHLDALEVLIINDGSKDQTVEKVTPYIDKWPEVFKLIDKENGGWGSTLNVGMKEATGKYFKQLDGDDYYSAEALDGFIEYLEECDADFVYTPFVIFNHQSGALQGVLGEIRAYPFKTTIPLKELYPFYPAMHALCVKTSILQSNDIFITEKCFYTDVEFVLKAIHHGSSMSFYNLPIYYYRLARDGQSMSLSGVRKNYKDHEKMLLNMLEYQKNHVMEDYKEKVFSERLASACEMQYIFFLALVPNEQSKHDLIEFDEKLRSMYPEYYNNIKNGAILFLRKTGFKGYAIVARLQTYRDKRKKINVFEGVE